MSETDDRETACRIWTYCFAVFVFAMRENDDRETACRIWTYFFAVFVFVMCETDDREKECGIRNEVSDLDILLRGLRFRHVRNR
jgi:hypothetical protein